MSANQNNALQILKVFSCVYKTKKSNNDVDKKISSALKLFEQLDLVKVNL